MLFESLFEVFDVMFWMGSCVVNSVGKRLFKSVVI